MSTDFKVIAFLEVWNSFLLTTTSPNFNVFSLILYYVEKNNILFFYLLWGILFLWNCLSLSFKPIFMWYILFLTSFYTYFLYLLLKLLYYFFNAQQLFYPLYCHICLLCFSIFFLYETNNNSFLHYTKINVSLYIFSIFFFYLFFFFW